MANWRVLGTTSEMPGDELLEGVLSKRLAGQLGGALFFLSGLVTLVSLLLPAEPGVDRAGIAAVAGTAMAVGIINWHLPWDRWPRWAALLAVPVAFTLIAFHNHFGAADPYRYGLFFVVAFIWIGLTFPRWTSVPFIPAFLVAYVVPLITSGHYSPPAAASAVYTTPVCLLAAETVAWVGERLRRAQRSLRQSESRFRSLVQHASDLVTVVDADGEVQYVSPSVSRLMGYQPPALLGSSIVERIHPDDQPRVRALLQELSRTPTATSSVEVRYRRADGSWRYVEAIASNLLDDPAVRGVVVNSRDITERRRAEEELAHQAVHDALTGLPNRALLRDRVEHAVERSRRSHRDVAVLFLDLDNFTVVNDSLGHDLGDQLLLVVAERLRACIGPGDTVARFAGDEFCILLEDVSGVEAATIAAADIMRALEEPVVLDGQELFIGACVGVAVTDGSRDSADDLMRNADVAMYRAKAAGKARFELFDPAMYARARERLALERDLRRAVERGEFRLEYQPVIDLQTNRVLEVEALLRWDHPERGVVSPLEFVPQAEETGLIAPIGQWVIEEACRQAADWQERSAAEPPIVVSVNLSARQFRQPALPDEISRVLRETRLDPACLKAEITESVLMEDTEATVASLRSLKSLGIQLAVDDFGTGYSSLSYLKRFPADTLKIDRSFVRGLAHNREDRALVRAMVAAGKALNLVVTAEGIETEAQAQELRTLGCDRGQGYLFARPLPQEAV